jgi:hypothetical protein
VGLLREFRASVRFRTGGFAKEQLLGPVVAAKTLAQMNDTTFGANS